MLEMLNKIKHRDGISKLLLGAYVVAFVWGMVEVSMFSWQSVEIGYLAHLLQPLSLTGYAQVAVQVASVLVCLAIYIAFIGVLTRPLQRFDLCGSTSR